MKMKAVTALAATMTFGASLALAAPVSQVGAGQTAITVGATQSQDKYSNNGYDASTDHDWNVNAGVQHGINDKWALEYQYHNLDAGNLGKTNTDVSSDQHEVNGVYKFNDNVSGYVGWDRISADVPGYKRTNNIAQAGLRGRYPLADKLDIYGQVGGGTKSTFTYEAGLAYDVNDNFNVNAGYRGLRTDLGNDTTYKSNGAVMGLTYKTDKL